MRMTATGAIATLKDLREALGITAPSKIDFKEDKCQRYPAKLEPATANRRFAKLRGTATSALSSDEIMALTREP